MTMHPAVKVAFRTVATVGRGEHPLLPQTLHALARLFAERNIRWLADSVAAEAAMSLGAKPLAVMDHAELAREADLVVAVGGDGTLLGVARVMADAGVPVIGINLGRLGFLTDIAADEAREGIEHILDGEFETEERELLSARLKRGSETLYNTLAMNDVVVARGAMGSMIEFSVSVDGDFVFTLRADGLIMSSATGSTAYALSAGGPILHPRLKAVSLVPIAPQSLSNRPVVIPSDCNIEVTLLRGPGARANFDVQSYWNLEAGDTVNVTRHARTLKLLHPKGYSYYAVLRGKLHWNERAG